MGKRKARAATGSFPEYDGFDLDQLYNERRSLGLQMQAVGKKYQGIRIRNDYLSARIRAMRNGETGIGISDHAVLRYLERVKGFDVKSVRDEIRARIALKEVACLDDQIVTDVKDDVAFAIYDGDRIATVWVEDGSTPPPHARKRPPSPTKEGRIMAPAHPAGLEGEPT